MSVQSGDAVNWAARIDALERRNQRLTGLVFLLIVMAAVQMVWHLMPLPKVIGAERFVVKRRGEPARAEMGMWQDGTPAFRINNTKGEAMALWALRKDGTLSLRLTDPDHTTRLELSIDPAGLPRVALFGTDGRSRAILGVDAANTAELQYPKR